MPKANRDDPWILTVVCFSESNMRLIVLWKTREGYHIHRESPHHGADDLLRQVLAEGAQQVIQAGNAGNGRDEGGLKRAEVLEKLRSFRSAAKKEGLAHCWLLTPGEGGTPPWERQVTREDRFEHLLAEVESTATRREHR